VQARPARSLEDSRETESGETSASWSSPGLLEPERFGSLPASGGNGRGRSVLAIAYQFPPSIEIGAQSCDQIFRHLSRYGWNVNVLTVKEHYHEERLAEARPFPGTLIRTGCLPHPLLVYQRFRGGRSGEHLEDAGPGPRTKERETQSARFRRWVLSLLSVPDCQTSWIPQALIAGIRAVKRHRVDCLFSSAPWWTNHLVGYALARCTGLPWVAHFRDPWTQGLWFRPMSDWALRLERAMEDGIVRGADAVVTVTERHADLLRRSHPDLDPRRFLSVPNGYDGAEWEALLDLGPGAPSPAENKFVITYAGNLYAGRSPELLFQAVRSLIDSGEADRSRIQIDLLGQCSMANGSRVVDLAAASGIADQVHLPGFLSRQETLRRMSRSSLLLILAEDWPYRVPAKTYEYLKAGRPILAITREEALIDLLKRTGGALVVEPGNRAAMIAALRRAYGSWRDGAESLRPDPVAVAALDRRLLAGRLAEVLESVLPAARPGHGERKAVEAWRR
jgi:glycosyltransferase involved in cell wall biosynthesis